MRGKWTSTRRTLQRMREHTLLAPSAAFAPCQEQPLWIEGFDTVDGLQAALDAFRHRSNHGWLVAKHGFLTPSAARQALTSGLEVAA